MFSKISVDRIWEFGKGHTGHRWTGFVSSTHWVLQATSRGDFVEQPSGPVSSRQSIVSTLKGLMVCLNSISYPGFKNTLRREFEPSFDFVWKVYILCTVVANPKNKESNWWRVVAGHISTIFVLSILFTVGKCSWPKVCLVKIQVSLLGFVAMFQAVKFAKQKATISFGTIAEPSLNSSDNIKHWGNLPREKTTSICLPSKLQQTLWPKTPAIWLYDWFKACLHRKMTQNQFMPSLSSSWCRTWNWLSITKNKGKMVGVMCFMVFLSGGLKHGFKFHGRGMILKGDKHILQMVGGTTSQVCSGSKEKFLPKAQILFGPNDFPKSKSQRATVCLCRVSSRASENDNGSGEKQMETPKSFG